MKKQTNYLLLSILLFAALLCALHSCTPCKDEGKEYQKFGGYWKIIRYSRNGEDLLDSLVKDTLQYVVFQASNRSEDRACYKIVPDGFSVVGFSADSLLSKSVDGYWDWNRTENKLNFRAFRRSVFSKNENVSEKEYYFIPFIYEINWTPTFYSDSLSLVSSYNEMEYLFILNKQYPVKIYK